MSFNPSFAHPLNGLAGTIGKSGRQLQTTSGDAILRLLALSSLKWLPYALRGSRDEPNSILLDESGALSERHELIFFRSLHR